jgi:hypothetical protein
MRCGETFRYHLASLLLEPVGVVFPSCEWLDLSAGYRGARSKTKRSWMSFNREGRVMKSIATGFCICFVLALTPVPGHAGQKLLTSQTPGVTMSHPPIATTHPVGKPPRMKPNAYKNINFNYDGEHEIEMDVHVGK